MRVLRMLCCVLLLTLSVKLASAQSVLLIASSYGKGAGPYTSVIQTPLVTAGYTVRVWEQLTLGWPPIDTLRAYNCVFFHGSERRGTGYADSILTAFAAEGGRVVIEGSAIASFDGAYPEFEQQAIHADWQRTKQTVYTNQIVAASHPIATGLPGTFTVSGYTGGNNPDKVLPAHGSTLVIQFQNLPGTVAVCATPRQAFYCGSLNRVTTTGNARNLLITNLVSWVLQNPDDSGIIDMGYGLGTSVGQSCPVWVKVRNFGPAETGQVILQASTDSATWADIYTATFNLAVGAADSLLFTWTPAVESRYYLRALMTTSGSDAYPSNNAAGMLVTTFDNALHPKLFFTAADIPTLQAQATTTHAAYYQALTQAVNVDLSFNPPFPSDWTTVHYPDFARIVSCAALKAVLTPTSTYINHAKNKTMALCRYPHWEPGANVDMDLYASRCCVALAMSYDWLYSSFSKAQRDTIQLKLREQLQRLAAAGPKWIWWSDAHVHNHNVNNMSYLGTATYALYEEEPEALIWEDMAIDNLDNIMALYGNVTDGSWYEAMNYWGFITWTMLPHLYLLREQRNINYFDRPWVQSFAKYRIYGSMANPSLMPMINEAQRDEWYGPGDQLALLASEYNDGEAQWMRQQVINYAGQNIGGPFGYFFYDPSQAETPPTDLSWIATDQDTYFGRSEWANTNATYVTLKCGLVCGRNAYQTYWGNGAIGGWEPSHFQPEQNAFTLGYGDDYMAQSAGLQHPLHRTFNANTMLVNGAGQIGDSTKGEWPLPANKLTMNPQLVDTFMLKHTDYVVGDATTAYPSTLGLTRYRRHLLYVRPDMVVVLDDMRATTPSTFTFIMRNPSNIFSQVGSKIQMHGSDIDADMHMLLPTNRTYENGFNYYYRTDWGGYGQRVSNAVADTSVRFVNVFYPRRPAASTAQLLFSDNGLTVLRLNDEMGTEYTCAISYGHAGAIDVDSLWTDASLAVVAQKDTTGKVTYGAVRQATIVDWGDPSHRLFESPAPVDVEWTVTGDTLRIEGAIDEWARFWAPGVVFVWLNGQAEPYNQNGPLIEIGNLESVPNGRIVNLTIHFDNGQILLDWTAPTFYINGAPTFPDFYDIYAADISVGPYSIIDSIPAQDDRYEYTGNESQKYFYVVARIDPAAMLHREKKHPRGLARNHPVGDPAGERQR